VQLGRGGDGETGWSDFDRHGESHGKNLYDHLGYSLVGYETAQVDGEAEKVDIYALEMPQV
jgi:hypothetical protein